MGGGRIAPSLSCRAPEQGRWRASSRNRASQTSIATAPDLPRRWNGPKPNERLRGARRRRRFPVALRRAKLHHMDRPRITQIPGIMGGKPCIKGTRITVETLVDHLASGETVAELLEGYPDITEEDVRAALAYAADHLRTQGLVAV